MTTQDGRAGKHAIIGIAAVAAVFIAGWFVASTGVVERFAPNGPESPANQASIAPGSDRAVDDNPTQPTPANPQQRTQLPGGPKASLHGKRLWPPAEDGRPRLIGRVIDRDERPVQGARVLAAAMWEPPIPLETPGFLDGDPPVIETTTDEEGHFRIDEGLRAGWYLCVTVLASPHAPWRSSKEWFDLDASTNLGDVQLAAGIELRGHVEDEDGAGIPGACMFFGLERGLFGVEEDLAGRGVPLGNTDAQGGFTLSGLAPGPWLLLVDAPGYRVGRLEGTANSNASRIAGLSVRLERGGRITGKLHDRPVNAVGNFVVESRQLDLSRDTDASVTAWPRRAPIRADGRFELTGLSPGAEVNLVIARLRTDGSSERIPAVEPVRAMPGTRGVKLEWFGATGFRAKMVDASSGLPIESGVILAENDSGWFYALPPMGADSNARYPRGNVLYDDLSASPGGRQLELAFKPACYVERKLTVNLRRGKLADLGTLEFEPGPGVSVTVTDGVSGDPVANARVLLADDDGRYLATVIRVGPFQSGNWMQYAETDVDGTARLPWVSGEHVWLLVQAPQRAAAWIELGTLDPVQAVHVPVTLKLGGSVEISLSDSHGKPVAKAVIESKMTDDGYFAHHAESSDSNGHALFANLAPGAWIFRQRLERRSWRADGFDYDAQWQRVDVREGERVQLKISGHSLYRLEGRVHEPKGPLRGARIYFEPVDARGGKFPAHDKKGNFVGYQVRSDGDGAFAFSNIVGGEYIVVVEHETRSMNARFPLTLDRDIRGLDWLLPMATLQGTLKDATGNTIADASVRLTTDQHGYSAGQVGTTLREGRTGELERIPGGRRLDEVRTDRFGNFRFDGLPERVDLTLSIHGPFVEPFKHPVGTLQADELRTLELTGVRAGAIGLGAPAQPGYWVRASQNGRSHLFPWEEPIELPSCLPGPWRIQLFAGTKEGPGDLLNSQTIHVVPGRRIDVEL